MKKSPSIFRIVPLVAAAAAWSPSLHAQSGTWTNTATGGLWSGTGNWAGGIVATGADNTADFNTLNITANNLVRLDSARTLGYLLFGDATTASNDWSLDNNGSAANILTLATTTGTTPSITVTNRTATISAVLAGTQGLVKSGTGILVITNTSTYSGGTTVSAGTLQIGSNSANGVIGGGDISITSGANVSFVGLSGITTVSQTISGAGRLTKSGVATTLVLTGSNTYTGGTTLSNGTIQGTDSTAYVGNANVLSNAGFGNSAPGTVAVNMGAGTGNLQFRVNGQSDSSSQTLTLFSNYASATSSQQTLTMTQSGGGGSYTIDVNREGGTGLNKTVEIAGYSSLVRNGTLNVTGGNGYSLRLANLILTSGNAGSNYTLNPTTASLKVGNITSVTTGSVTLTLDGAASGNIVSGTISNNSASNTTSLTKSGTSTWTLSGTSTYTGATTVTAGTLLVDGSIAAGSAVTVGASGTLGGIGTINGTVSVDGVLAPGASPGVLKVNNSVTINNGGALAIELNGATLGTDYDQLALTSGSSIFSLTNTNNLQLTLGYVPTAGTQFTIVDIAGANAVAGIFEQLNGVTTDLSQDAIFIVSGVQFQISYTAEGSTFSGAGNNVMLQVVPEPGSVALLGLAGTVLMVFRRRRN
jgi:autotransporter-associated beta strand protein